MLIILQARLASTRLPAKALLPLAGLPAFVLSARRAANTGRRVLLATSTDSPDDAIVAAAAEHGIEVHRGPQHDVLERFAVASRNLPASGVVVRLTADNTIPDGTFVDELLACFRAEGVDYLGTSSPYDGLPYGVSAEVFNVDSLRRAQQHAVSSADREHVTPWIRRNCTSLRYRDPRALPHWARLRCTLDTFEDYKLLVRVFAAEKNASLLPWRDLIERVADASLGGRSARCRFREGRDGKVHSVLTLGAVQLGLPYGIANKAGMPPDAEVEELLATATDAGITAFDTARAYGESEERLGRLFPSNFLDRTITITKLDVLATLGPGSDRAMVRCATENSVLTSIQKLRRRRLDALLLHRAAHRQNWNGAAWTRLLELRDEGTIGLLGVSVNNPAEAIDALRDENVALLQCPVNLLDHRWREPEFLDAVAQRPDVIVHARSALLQGLLTLPPDRWPANAATYASRVSGSLVDLQAEFGRSDVVDLALAYVTALPWVWSVVIGCDTAAQLRENLARVERSSLSVEQLAKVEARFHDLPEHLLDPSQWTKAS